MYQQKQALISELNLDHSWLSKAALLATGVVLLSLSAKLKIAFYPVPMTLQTLVVLLIALTYGRTLSLATISSYIGAGALGFPVFAQGGGIAYLLGPTGGFLLGFVVATVAVSYVAQHVSKLGMMQILSALLLGEVIIFACGLAWLGYFIGWGTSLLSAGLYPFIQGEIAKISVASLILPSLITFVLKLRNKDS